MLKAQFYTRLVFIGLFGIIFIWAMINMARRNPISNIKEKLILRKILAFVFILLGIINATAAIVYLEMVSPPSEMCGQPFSVNMIVRKVGTIQYWGYPTDIQQFAITFYSNIFISAAFAGYSFYFRKSSSAWWEKILKVILVILTYAFYVSSTDWHYFDFPEFIATVLFAVCIAAMFVKSKKSLIDEENIDKPHNSEISIKSSSSNVENTISGSAATRSSHNLSLNSVSDEIIFESEDVEL